MTDQELTPERKEVLLDLVALINKGLPLGFNFTTLKMACACLSCQGSGCPTCHSTGFNIIPLPTP